MSLTKEERKMVELFQPDVLLGEQYLAMCRKYLEPEARLMLAVLEDAIACFQKHIFDRRDDQKNKAFQETQDWIFEDYLGGPFSFEAICETLDFNPQYVRKGLKEWKKRALRGRR